MLSDFMLLRCRASALYHPVGELVVDPRCLESANLTLMNVCSDSHSSNQECELSLGLTRTIFALCNGNRNDRCRDKDKQAAFDSASLLMFERC